VQRCVFPKGPQSCTSSSASTTCGGTPADGPKNNRAVRIACSPGGDAAPRYPAAENCALWGQTCASDGSLAVCAGDDTGLSCSREGCFGDSELRWCRHGVDVGIDCAGNGAQHCGGLPDRDASAAVWVACIPDSDAGSCTPDASALCSNGKAVSCPAGLLETIDCKSLLGTDGGTCAEGSLDPPFDWTSPCVVTPAACTADTCVDGSVVGCARGAPFPLDCAKEGLGQCQMLSPEADAGEAHAACTPPP
jgi:hypothetical protein